MAELRKFAQTDNSSLADNVLRGGLVTNQPTNPTASPAGASNGQTLANPNTAPPLILMGLRRQAQQQSAVVGQTQVALQQAAAQATSAFNNANSAMAAYRQSYAEQVKMLQSITATMQQKQAQRQQLQAAVTAATPAAAPTTPAPAPATTPAPTTKTTSSGSGGIRVAEGPTTPQIAPMPTGKPAASTPQASQPASTEPAATSPAPAPQQTLQQAQQALNQFEKAYQQWHTQTEASKKAFDEQVEQAHADSNKAMADFVTARDAYQAANNQFLTAYQQQEAILNQLSGYATDENEDVI